MGKNFTNKKKLTVGIASVILGMGAVLGTSTVSYADATSNEPKNEAPKVTEKNVETAPQVSGDNKKLYITVDANTKVVDVTIRETKLVITKGESDWRLTSGEGYEVKNSNGNSFSIQKKGDSNLPNDKFEILAKISNEDVKGKSTIITKTDLSSKVPVVNKNDLQIIEKENIKKAVSEVKGIKKEDITFGDKGEVQYKDNDGNIVFIALEDVVIELAKPSIYSDVDSNVLGLKHTDKNIIIKLNGKEGDIKDGDVLEVKVGENETYSATLNADGSIKNSSDKTKIIYQKKSDKKDAYYEITGVSLNVGEKVVAKLSRETVFNETEVVVLTDINEVNEDLKSAEDMIPGLIYNNTSIADRFNEKYFFNVDFGTSLYKLFTGDEDKELGMFKGFNMVAGLQAGYTFRPINNLNLTVFGEYDKPRYHQVMFGLGTKYLDFSGFGRYRLTIINKEASEKRKLLHSIDLYARYSHEFNAGSHVYLTPAIGAYGSVTMPTKLTEEANLKPMVNLSVDGSLKIGYMMDTLIMYAKPSFKFGYVVVNLEHVKTGYLKSEDEYNKMLSYGLEFGTEKVFKDHINFGLSTTFAGKLNQLKNSDDKSYGRANIKLSSHVGYQW